MIDGGLSSSSLVVALIENLENSMAAPKGTATKAQWEKARQLFESGVSYQSIAEQLSDEAGKPFVSYQVIRRRALHELWTRVARTPPENGPHIRSTESRRKRTEDINAIAQFSLATHMAKLTEQLAEASSRLVTQMFQPHEIIEFKVTAVGSNMGSEVRVIREILNEPSPRDKASLASAAAQLIDRLQILTGGVTSRTEIGPIGDRAAAEARLRMVRDELSERRQVILNKEAADKAKLADGEVG